MIKRIFLFSHDPGGANTIIPLIKPLIKKGYKTILFGIGISLKKYKFFALKTQDLSKYIKKTARKEIYSFLKKLKPNLIITGTSSEDFTERFLWKAASKLNIPSFTIIDHWTNYGIRFSKFPGSKHQEYLTSKRLDFLPTKIFVPDKYAKKEMIKEGFPKSKLLVTGNPFFEHLMQYKTNLVNRQKTRKKLGIKKNDFVITYASEPTEGRKTLQYWGYTEKTVFKHIYKSLEKIVEQYGQRLILIIKLHPREQKNSYFKAIANLKNKKIKILIYKNTFSWNLINASDLICGMSSMFLIESVLLSKPTLSIQIGLKRKDPFILSKRRILKTIIDKETLIDRFEQIIVKKQAFNYNFSVINNPIKNIIYQVKKHLK